MVSGISLRGGGTSDLDPSESAKRKGGACWSTMCRMANPFWCPILCVHCIEVATSCLAFKYASEKLEGPRNVLIITAGS